MLTAVVFLPLAGALCALLVPREEEGLHRGLALGVSTLTLLLSLALLAGFDPASGAMQHEQRAAWIDRFGIAYHVGIDGISLFLVLLTTLLVPVALLSAWRSVDRRVKEFAIAMLVLETGMVGAFVALDLFLFYVFWELMLVPMYLLIGIWGHERRVYAAIKFVLFTIAGSLLMLAAIVYLHVEYARATGESTFALAKLSTLVLPPTAQRLCFLAFALAFAIKVPLVPLHTWLPDAHVEAPTAGSVILAGVLLKFGTYGLLRFAMPMFPLAAVELGPLFGVLAVAGVIYASLVALAQKDAKRLVAYSSVAHLGLVVLGLFALTAAGIQGAIYQMVGHGLTAAGLFMAVGALYERRHTRELAEFGGLYARMPGFGAVLLVLALASVGLPGLSNFVGEFLVLAGTFTSEGLALGRPRLLAALAATGVVLGAVYTLWMVQRLLFGPLSNPKNRELRDLGGREWAAFAPLLAAVLLLGLAPRPLLARMAPSVRAWQSEFAAAYGESLARRDGDAPTVRVRAGVPAGEDAGLEEEPAP